MTEAPNYRQRKSLRLKGHDYSQDGAYFITICTVNKTPLLGTVIDNMMIMNDHGLIVETEWLKTGSLRANVDLDVFVVMPNHFHGVIGLWKTAGTARRAPTIEQFGRTLSGSLPSIVRAFKSAVTRRINRISGTPGRRIWQRGYYEHIIRNENDLTDIRNYIVNNPLKWHLDKYYGGR
ncbi:MAG: transposase [candidate division Zixibacteria bacterium]|nr:transposase [candidate division Zixibacteria bacterium]